MSVLEEVVPHASGMVVVQKEPGECSEVVRAAARLLSTADRPIPVAVLAPGGIVRDWARIVGTSPVFAAVISEDGMSLALRVVVKEILTNPNNKP